MTSRRRGREGSLPSSPRTDPGVRFSRTGLPWAISGQASDSFASANAILRVFAIPHSEVGLGCPALHVRPRFPLWATAACQSLPLANLRFARDRPYRLRVLWTDPTPWSSSASLLVLSALPTCFLPGTPRVSQVLDVSLHASHALRGPRQTLGSLTIARSLCWLLVR